MIWKGIAHHPYLDTTGMVVNREIDALICEGCMIALRPCEVQGHLDHQHRHCGLVINQKRFDEAREELEVHEKLPVH